jgi:hypothetical protein
MENVLNYSIATERLEGTVAQQYFSIRAWSGGGRGQVGNAAEHNWDSYNVFRKEKDSGGKHRHGGPIPPGIYMCQYVAHHPKFGECIFLEQTITALFQVDAKAGIHLYNRDGFFIHGRGPHGSDGCIVPENDAQRRRLNKAVKDALGAVMLKVGDQGMPLPAARERSTRTA